MHVKLDPPSHHGQQLPQAEAPHRCGAERQRQVQAGRESGKYFCSNNFACQTK